MHIALIAGGCRRSDEEVCVAVFAPIAFYEIRMSPGRGMRFAMKEELCYGVCSSLVTATCRGIAFLIIRMFQFMVDIANL